MISIKDIKILTLMNVNERFNPYKASSVSDIVKYYDDLDSSISLPTIRRSLSKLLEEGYVKEGYKRGKNKTYYISDAGIRLLSEII